MDFDENFVKNIIQQDELAFAHFYEQSIDVFFRYVHSHYSLDDDEINDIVSSLYLKIWNSLNKYSDNYSFGQFVWGILKNHCKDYIKKSKPILFSQLVDEFEQKKSNYFFEEESDDLFQFSVDSEVLKNALSCLDKESQELIYLRFVLSYDYLHMSQIFSTSVENIRKKVSRIIKKLRLTLSHIK